MTDAAPTTEPEPRMDPDPKADAFAIQVYEASRWVARAGWLILAISLFMPSTRWFAWPAAQFVIPAIFCLGYILMVWKGRSGFKLYGLGTFFALPKIGYLYTNKSALNASWLHFLAFDLFAGAWMVRDGTAHDIPVWLIFLCLPFTLILGPVGLLFYIVLRFAFVGLV
jgi:hypothetical protein